MSIWHKPWFIPCGIRHILIVKTYAAVSASDDDAEMAVFLYREAAMRRVLGLMLFCFGIGMPLALSILKGQGGDIDVDFGGRREGTTFILKFFK